MPRIVTVTLTDREQEAFDWIRASLSLRSDEQTVFAGLYKLAAWLEPNVDPTLFRLDRDAPAPPKKRKA